MLNQGLRAKIFVTCFTTVVTQSEKLKEFCQELSGVCIDARTRTAFDHVLRDRDGLKPTLENLIASQAKKNGLQKQLYLLRIVDCVINR